ncbi:2-oxoglutarate dehydrogenase E1 component [Paraburkholderia sp. 35.1]|uniref:2-oxoglutarate dehydrogenase E1 component n=1 Tax=Paraburkholderia sp. 35.1 TaxID=2991058 RepID=UPI003D226EB3
MFKERQSSFLFGGNAPYVEEQYELYLADPNAVTAEWRAWFDALRDTPAIDGSDRDDQPHAPVISSFVELAKRPPRAVVAASNEAGSEPDKQANKEAADALGLARKQVAVQTLIAAFRMIGARVADLDPLAWTPPRSYAELTPAYYGLSAADMSTTFSTADTFLFEDDAKLKDIVAALAQTYTGTLGAEFMHLADAQQRRWWQIRLESTRATPSLHVAEKLRLLERLSAAEGLEKHLHARYVGQTRFSLEGGESLIVLLDELVRYGASKKLLVNNQIGFTTSDPRDTRSSFYTTDVAKMIEAPILHVNGDDPEAVAMGARLALDYRSTFKRSVVIDLVCFHKYGHQEQDTPAITQPLMYRSIASHPGVRTRYANRLIQQGVLTTDEAQRYVSTRRELLERAHETVGSYASPLHEEAGRRSRSAAQTGPARHLVPSADDLRGLAQRISTVPADLTLHPLVRKMMNGRQEMASGKRQLDWGMGEHLAFASLLVAGISIRLSGQDSARGTFNHRHAVLHDQTRINRPDGVYVPLDHIGATQGRFTVTNSILSEAAVLAFEYGYSTVNRNALVIWEAQFGDFANGAQVVIDQFIAAGAAKWGQHSGLTLFLPHGQEGQGPEHASARLERYLQLSAQNNMRVAEPTTPAQLFHLLLMQARASERRPLVVMTPKSLLRHPEATSTFDELSHGEFREVLPDTQIDASRATDVERVIVTSGKVYFELLEHRRSAGMTDTPIIRVEQLYAFPAQQLAAELARYPNLKSVAWCQEQARNQGAWSFVEPLLREILPAGTTLLYAGPDACASTAPGSYAAHVARQSALVSRAFTG